MQFIELEAFSQFSFELDKATQNQFGKREYLQTTL